MTNLPSSSPLRIGLTGAGGVLGQTLQKIWPEVEWNVFPGDLCDFQQVQSWYTGLGPVQGIIHLAALVPTHLVESDPLRALQTNVVGTCHLLNSIRIAANGNSVPWVFLASTSHVYASSDQPLSEEAPLDPISLYGLTKLQSEEWGKVFIAKFKIPICIGRIFSYSSHLQPDTYFIPSMIKKISGAPVNSKLEIFGLQGTRDFLTGEAVCLGIKGLFEKKATGIFNLASGKGQKLFDIVKTIQNRLDRNDIEILAPLEGTHHLIADVERINDLGIYLEFKLNRFLDVLLSHENIESTSTMEPK